MDETLKKLRGSIEKYKNLIKHKTEQIISTFHLLVCFLKNVQVDVAFYVRNIIMHKIFYIQKIEKENRHLNVSALIKLGGVEITCA